jgi:hypothetical protein
LNKTNIYPLILPQKYYTDQFGKPNAYIEMNPSMNIDENGKVQILIRCINYRKFHNKQFVLFEPHSNSVYFLLSGNMKEGERLNVDNFETQEITYHYGIPTYYTYWKGMEDIRFVNSSHLLITVPECNKNGNPSIFQAKIEDKKIHSFEECRPNITEKNWMPFIGEDGNPYVIYSLSPFRVKQIKEDIFTEIDVSSENANALQGYHGSTNGISYHQFQLFLIHINREKSYHRWLLFDPISNEIRLSDEFVFFKHTYIEFPVSLCQFKDRLFISLGINDDKAFIIETPLSEIDHIFTP